MPVTSPSRGCRASLNQPVSSPQADERATAAALHIPVAALHGTATFYDDLARSRRGNHHVRVCEGTASIDDVTSCPEHKVTAVSVQPA